MSRKRVELTGTESSAFLGLGGHGEEGRSGGSKTGNGSRLWLDAEADQPIALSCFLFVGPMMDDCLVR